MILQGFLELNLNSRVLRAIEAMGFEEPTPVQARVIPHMFAGKDVIVQAQTGSGKTAAYGIPIAQKVDLALPKIQALVLSPTRELALQVSVHLSQLGQYLGLKVVPVYGGQSYHHQTRAIRGGAHVVVATPGRLLDLMEQRVISLANVRILVLDEADEMLAMGFQEDVERILSHAPEDRQTALFSATMPREIISLANSFLHEPERIILSKPRAVTVETVAQSYYMVPRPFKLEALTQLLDVTSPQLALIFCATKQMTADLGRELHSRGYRAAALHGDMTQAQRESVMAACRTGQYEVLVATDVAARGLDIPEVSHVFNFDIPQDADRYVHRIGRTARAGRAGEAITLISPRESGLFRTIQQTVGTRIDRKELPTAAEIEERERASMVSEMEQALLDGQWNAYRPLVEHLAQRHDPLDLAAAALHRAFGPARPRQEVPRVRAEGPSPKSSRRGPRRGAPRPFRKGPRPRRR